MGKVKSAIITSLLVAAIIVLAFFATVSFPMPGTNGVNRYNSFVSSISLGREFTGEAYSMLYPDGVFSAEDYKMLKSGDGEKYSSHGGLYVEKSKIEKEEDAKALKDSVAKDAAVISKRFKDKGYAGYSVFVEDEYSIKITVPTGFTYKGYKNIDRGEELTNISHTIQYLILDGDLSLRDSADEGSKSVLGTKEDFSDYFSKVTKYSMGGNHAVRLVLNKAGFEKLKSAIGEAPTDDDSTSSTENTSYFYVGDTNLGLQIQGVSDRTMYYSATESYAEDFAILIASVVGGDIVENKYNDAKENSGTSIVTTTATFGDYAAMYLFCGMLLLVVVAAVVSIIKYKKLGLVNALMVIAYALVMVCALMLLEIQVSLAGAFAAVIGLALLTFSNFYAFEEVRKQTETGRTFRASVKDGYKSVLFNLLKLHGALAVVAMIAALIGFGELGACGFILFVATLASYALHWFTRLMWYVTASPAKDKFKFCGYAREVLDDED